MTISATPTIQIWSPFSSTLDRYGWVRYASGDSGVFSFVNTPTPALSGHYWLKMAGTATAQQDYAHIDHAAFGDASAPTGARVGLRLSAFLYLDGAGAPNADQAFWLWFITGITGRTNLRLGLDSDGKVRLRYTTGLLAESSVALPVNAIFQLVFWRITRDAAGNRINDQYVCQLVEDVWGARTTTTLFNVQDSAQAALAIGTVTWFYKLYASGAMGSFNLYGHSFYCGYEDANTPSGIIRDTEMLPSGAGTYDQWTGSPEATDKWKNVDETSPVTTDYNRADLASQYRQSHALPDNAVPAIGGVNQVVKAVNQPIWLENENDIAGKTAYIRALIADGTHTVEDGSYAITDLATWENFPPPGTTYGEIWQTAPDAAAWTPAKLDSLQIGYREGDGGASVRVAATKAIPCHYLASDTIAAPPAPPAVGGFVEQGIM